MENTENASADASRSVGGGIQRWTSSIYKTPQCHSSTTWTPCSAQSATSLLEYSYQGMRLLQSSNPPSPKLPLLFFPFLLLFLLPLFSPILLFLRILALPLPHDLHNLSLLCPCSGRPSLPPLPPPLPPRLALVSPTFYCCCASPIPSPLLGLSGRLSSAHGQNQSF